MILLWLNLLCCAIRDYGCDGMGIITWSIHFGLHARFSDMSREVAEPVINAFLTHQAVKEKVCASTQNQGLSAPLFLIRFVTGREAGDLDEVIRARKPRRLPGDIASIDRDRYGFVYLYNRYFPKKRSPYEK